MTEYSDNENREDDWYSHTGNFNEITGDKFNKFIADYVRNISIIYMQ